MSPDSFKRFKLPKKNVIRAVERATRAFWRENREELPYVVIFSLRDAAKLERGRWKGGRILNVPVRVSSFELPIDLVVVFVDAEVLEKGKFGVAGSWPVSS